MSERASRQNFAFRFYKTGDANMEGNSNNTERSFKEVEWFSHRKGIEQHTTQGGSLELDSPMINRGMNTNDRKSSSKKLSSTHYLHQHEIINSLEQRGFTINQDLR